MSKPIALSMLFGGGLLIYSGISRRPVLGIIQGVTTPSESPFYIPTQLSDLSATGATEATVKIDRKGIAKDHRGSRIGPTGSDGVIRHAPTGAGVGHRTSGVSAPPGVASVSPGAAVSAGAAAAGPKGESITQHLRRNGVPKSKIPMVLGILGGESAWGTNDQPARGCCHGPWQINLPVHGVSLRCALDWNCATKQARKISNNWTNFSPWEAYTNGSYRQYIGQDPTAGARGSAGAPSRTDLSGTGLVQLASLAHAKLSEWYRKHPNASYAEQQRAYERIFGSAAKSLGISIRNPRSVGRKILSRRTTHALTHGGLRTSGRAGRSYIHHASRVARASHGHLIAHIPAHPSRSHSIVTVRPRVPAHRHVGAFNTVSSSGGR